MTPTYNDERFYWLWLQRFLGIGSNKVAEVLEYFKNPKLVYEASDDELINSSLFSTTEFLRRSKIVNKKLLDILKYCDQNNIRIVSYLDNEYPECLRRIEAPPTLLFVRGTNMVDIFPSIAIVGKRESTVYGEKASFSLSAKLSLAGFSIVSGGARGIDRMAHLGALAAGGKTIVVLGSGIDSNYLKCNKDIRKAAEQNGVVISEFAPKASATKYTFPIRNRIISALSSGVAVIQAGEKSGALITASYAMEQGREVFAVPGNISQEEYKGNNQLIKDGAIILTSVEDVLSVYSGRFGDILKSNVQLSRKITRVLYSELEKNKRKTTAQKKGQIKVTQKAKESEEDSNYQFKAPDINKINCSDNAKKVLAVFDEEILMSDTMSAKSGVNGAEFITVVTELELKGYIKAVPVGRYRITVKG